MDLQTIIILVISIIAFVLIVKLIFKISKFVISAIAVILVIALIFGSVATYLSYKGIVDLGDYSPKSIMLKSKEKVTGYVVENVDKGIGKIEKNINETINRIN